MIGIMVVDFYYYTRKRYHNKMMENIFTKKNSFSCQANKPFDIDTVLFAAKVFSQKELKTQFKVKIDQAI